MRTNKLLVKFADNQVVSYDRIVERHSQAGRRFLLNWGEKMYIEITIDLTKYNGKIIDLRLSDYYTMKKMIDIAWQANSISKTPREGYWVRVVNKEKIFPGHLTLANCGITTGDRIEII